MNKGKRRRRLRLYLSEKSKYCSFLYPSLQVSTCKFALFTVQPWQSSKVITRPCVWWIILHPENLIRYFFVNYSRSVCGMSGPTEPWAETDTAHSICDARKTIKLLSSGYLYISSKFNILVPTLENWIQMWTTAFFILQPVLNLVYPDLRVLLWNGSYAGIRLKCWNRPPNSSTMKRYLAVSVHRRELRQKTRPDRY